MSENKIINTHFFFYNLSQKGKVGPYGEDGEIGRPGIKVGLFILIGCFSVVALIYQQKTLSDLQFLLHLTEGIICFTKVQQHSLREKA